MPNKAVQYAKGIANNNQQNFRRLAGWYKAMHGLDQAAIATAPIPVVGDLVGLAADVRTFKEEPSWANAGWLAAGTVIPFVGGKAVKEAVTSGMDAIKKTPEPTDLTKVIEDKKLDGKADEFDRAELSAREMRKKAREKRPSFQEKYDFNTGLREIQAKRLEEYSARMLEQDRQLKNSPYGEQLFKQRDKMLEELGIDLQDLNKEAVKSGISEQLGLYLEKKEALVKLQQSPISDEIAKAILDAENLFDLREITNPGLNRQ